MGSPAGRDVQRGGLIEPLFVSKIVRDRNQVRPGRRGYIPGAGAIEAVRREGLNCHFEQTLPRGLAAITGRPRSCG